MEAKPLVYAFSAGALVGAIVGWTAHKWLVRKASNFASGRSGRD